METIADITIRLNTAVNKLEWRKEYPLVFITDNMDLKIEIMEIQAELFDVLKTIL